MNAVALMQNSGIGYSLNVLTSFNLVYRVPIPIIVSWRGYGGNDAVEHDVIGSVVTDLLGAVGIPYRLLDGDDPESSVQGMLRSLHDTGRPSVLLVTEGV
ncbi:hypothetical protein [Nocardiopsis rhodophaea]|uniref:hypothetical protein n=1 Tax=Nocardiopsis rhodophaea TaxID=280238 RepID=UPI0031D54B0B